MPALKESIIESGDLRVVFDRRGHFWGHRVEWMAEAGPQVVLASAEGTRGNADAPHPPVQDIQVQPTGEGQRTVLGVGTYGKSYWSLSCSAGTGSPERPRGDWILFRLACRVREALPALACSYQIVPPAALVSTAAHAAEAPRTDGRFRVETSEHLTVAGDRLSIVVRGADARPLPYTVEWSYAVGLVPQSSSD